MMNIGGNDNEQILAFYRMWDEWTDAQRNAWLQGERSRWCKDEDHGAWRESRHTLLAGSTPEQRAKMLAESSAQAAQNKKEMGAMFSSMGGGMGMGFGSPSLGQPSQTPGQGMMGNMPGLGQGGMGNMPGLGQGGMGNMPGLGQGGMGNMLGLGQGGMGNMPGLGQGGMGNMPGLGQGGMGNMPNSGPGGMGNMFGNF